MTEKQKSMPQNRSNTAERPSRSRKQSSEGHSQDYRRITTQHKSPSSPLPINARARARSARLCCAEYLKDAMPKRPAVTAPSFFDSVPSNHLSDQPTDRPGEDGREPWPSKNMTAETVPKGRVYRFPFHPLLQIKVPHRNSVPCSLSPDGPNGRAHIKKDLPATVLARMNTVKELNREETSGGSEMGM